MLSRIAESLLWIGRLAERAEDVSRILDVYVHLLLEESALEEATACATLMSVVGVPAGDEPLDATRMLELLAFDPESPICASLSGARENARTVREVISSEMWECLNTTYNTLPAQRSRARRLGPPAFFGYVRERTALLAGLVDATMSHDDGWRFVVIGRSLERADMTVRALSLDHALGDRPTSTAALLRSCGGWEAFLRTYRGTVTQQSATEFLVLDRLFPRSVFAAVATAERLLGEMETAAPTRIGVDDPALRLLGRLRTALEFARPGEVARTLGDWLADVQRTCSTVSDLIAERYFRMAASNEWLAGQTL